MAQLGGAPQLDLQMAVVNVLKENGAKLWVYDLKRYQKKK